MDQHAQQAATAAQEAQNQTINAAANSVASLASVLLNLISAYANKPIELKDLVIKSGNKTLFPSNEENANLDLNIKLKDAFTNVESKISLNIFLEYPDGTTEQIFKQVGGKIPNGGDPFNLAPAMQKMFAEQAAQKFANPAPPKVVVQVGSGALLEQIENNTQTKGKGIDPTTLSKAEAEVVSMIDSLENTANVEPQNLFNQRSDKKGQNNTPTRAEIFNAIPMSDEEIDSTLDDINKKMAKQPPQSLDRPISASATGKIIPANFGNSIADGLTQDKVLALGDPRLKFAYLKADSIRQELNRYYEQAKNPGYEYKLKLPIIETLQNDYGKASSSVIERLTALQKEGRWNPDAIALDQKKPEIVEFKNERQIEEEAFEVQRQEWEQEQEWERRLPTYEPDGELSEEDYEVWQENQIAKFEFMKNLSEVEPVKDDDSAVISNADKIEQQMMQAIAPKFVSDTVETALKPEVIPATDRLSLDNLNDPAPTNAERNESFILNATTSSVADRDWIPAIQELKEVIAYVSYDAPTLELAATHETESNQLMAEVFALSAEIEGLRTQANHKLIEHSDFTKTLGDVAIDPQIKDWATSSTQTVQTQAVSIGDRLRNAATGLVDTVKARASNDWKTVVDAVKERASNDTQTVKETIKTRLSDNWGSVKDTVAQKATEGWEKIQKGSIESEQVHKGIDTYIKHVGKSEPAGGVAELDGYIFARLGEDRRIFRADTRELLYKGGLMTDKANSKDAAYLARFPKVAEKAAAVAEKYNQSQSESNRAGASMKR